MPIDPARRALPAFLDQPLARAGIWLASCALSACAATPLPPATPSKAVLPPVDTAQPRPAPSAPSTTAPTSPTSPTSPTTTAPSTAPATDSGMPTAPALAPSATLPSLVRPEPSNAAEGQAAARLLRYADRVRGLTPAELALEIAALGDPGQVPERQLQLSLALLQMNQPVETARALGLAQRVANSLSPESAPLKPLARLLVQRLMEHRKIEETLDKQNAQLREQTRRIEQLNDRLEAMRAIERSINARPPATAPRAPVTP